MYSQDDHDETYEYCPDCNSDAYLIDKKDGDVFIKSPFTGLIINTRTKAPLLLLTNVPPLKQRPAVNMAECIEKRQKRDLELEEAIDKYIQVYETDGQQAAEAAYLKTLKS